MLVHASANRPLDLLLEKLCLELGLSEEQHARASRAYESVGNWLSDPAGDLGRFDPRVYPQGSIPQGTAVRPRETDEFDADGVCLLRFQLRYLSPSDAYRLVWERIRAHGTYRDRVTPRERCLRVDYEGQLHLDIVPAIPSPAGGSAILIPSRKQNEWQPTNPEGFASWFLSRCEPISLTKIGADAEPMPPHEDPLSKAPLQRVVQLMKRRRDVHFQSGDDGPRSILISALAGQLWSGHAYASDGLLHILGQLAAGLPVGSPPRVPNPVDASENLARQWYEKPSSYQAFREFVADFQYGMGALLRAEGIPEIAKGLSQLFDVEGSGVVERAVRRFTDSFQDDRQRGLVRSTRPARAAASSSVAIPPNNFYGS